MSLTSRGTPDNTAGAKAQPDGLRAASVPVLKPAPAAALAVVPHPQPAAGKVADACDDLALRLSKEAEIQDLLKIEKVAARFSKLKLTPDQLALEIANNAIQHVLEETADVLAWFKQPNSIIYYKSSLYAVMRQLSLKLNSASEKLLTNDRNKYFADSAVHHKEIPKIAAEIKDTGSSKKKKKQVEVSAAPVKLNDDKKFKLNFKSYLNDKSFDAKVENSRVYIPVCIGFKDAISGEQLRLVVERYKAAGVKEIYLFIPRYDDHKISKSEWLAAGAEELIAWLNLQDVATLKNVKLLPQGPLHDSVSKYLSEKGVQYLSPLTERDAYKAAVVDTTEYLKDSDVSTKVYEDAKAYLIRGLKAYQHDKLNANAGATPSTSPPLPSPPPAAAKTLTADAPPLELPAATASATGVPAPVPGLSTNPSTTAALVLAMAPKPLAMAGGASTIPDRKMTDAASQSSGAHATNGTQALTAAPEAPMPLNVAAAPPPSGVPDANSGVVTPRFLALVDRAMTMITVRPESAEALGYMLSAYGRGRGGGMVGGGMFHRRPSMTMPPLAESSHPQSFVPPVPGGGSIK